MKQIDTLNRNKFLLILFIIVLSTIFFRNSISQSRKISMQSMNALLAVGLKYYIEDDSFRKSLDSKRYVSYSNSDFHIDDVGMRKEVKYQLDSIPNVMSIHFILIGDQMSVMCSTDVETAVMLNDGTMVSNFGLK